MKRIRSKTLLLILIQCTLINTVCANTGHDVKIQFKCYGVENGKGVTSYTINATDSRNCDLTFWALPAEDSVGNFSSYTIKVNEIELTEKVTFDQFGWQEMYTQNKTISLRQGENTVTFISKGRDLPQIKQLEIFDGKKKHTTENNILSIISNTKTNKNITVKKVPHKFTLNNMLTEPVYRPGVAYNQEYSSTFLLPLYYEAGEKASYYGPTVNDPVFGIYESTVEYNVYFFYENPELFSISDASHNKYVGRETNSLPYTGVYYLLVEAQTVGEMGGVTLFIDYNLYKYSIVSNCELSVDKEVPRSLISVDNKESPYNMFTINSRSFDNTKEADPCLWLKKQEVDSENFIIVAYNENNTVRSDFDWRNNARIRTPLIERTNYKLLLASSSSINGFQKDTCDVYHSFWSTPWGAGSEYYKNDFPLLKEEDLIESGRSRFESYSHRYNCISWSAGVNYIWINPVDSIEWFDRLYNNEKVQDGIVSFARPASFPRYTREGATKDNSVVDLWGIVNNGDTTFTHASISHNIDSNPHGYDWESKLGWDARVFHPRYALSGPAYGNVLAHYRIADNQFASNNNPQIMIAEAIADEELIIENIYLTSEEEDIIAKEIENISSKDIDVFETLYANWKYYTNQHSHESFIWRFRECAEYAELLKAINLIKKGEFLVYDKFNKDDFLAVVLMKDLSARPENNTEEIWKGITEAPMAQNVVRTPKTNVTLYLKAILQKTKNPEIGKKMTRSNDNSFNVTVFSSQLTVEVDLEQPAQYTIQIMNIETNSIRLLVSDKLMEKGKHTHACNVSPGLYVINYIHNGNMNSKKIVIH